jgi:DEAD/DEAH box helicase domain-containing protein
MSLVGTGDRILDFVPTIVCYESGGGGAGIMAAIEERLLHIFNKGLGILKSCTCLSGCTNCTHLYICEKGNEPLDKIGGIQLIESFLTSLKSLT